MDLRGNNPQKPGSEAQYRFSCLFRGLLGEGISINILELLEENLRLRRFTNQLLYLLSYASQNLAQRYQEGLFMPCPQHRLEGARL